MGLRITTGCLKGKIIKAPPTTLTRPTTDRIKQAIFNILTHSHGVKWTNMVVGDFFAGSGALGLEALSRGAAHCSFIENSSIVLPYLRDNINRCSMTPQSHLITQDFFLKKTPFPVPFDVIFCDPPYATYPITLLITMMTQLQATKVPDPSSSSRTIICLEDRWPYPFVEEQLSIQQIDSSSQDNKNKWHLLEQRSFGHTGIYLYSVTT